MEDPSGGSPRSRACRMEAAWGGPIDVADASPVLRLPRAGDLALRCRLHGRRGRAMPPGWQILAGLALGQERVHVCPSARGTEAIPTGADPLARRARGEQRDLAEDHLGDRRAGWPARGPRRAPSPPARLQPGAMTPDGVILAEHLTKSYGATRGMVDVSGGRGRARCSATSVPTARARRRRSARCWTSSARRRVGPRCSAWNRRRGVEIHRRIGYLPGEIAVRAPHRREYLAPRRAPRRRATGTWWTRSPNGCSATCRRRSGRSRTATSRRSADPGVHAPARAAGARRADAGAGPPRPARFHGLIEEVRAAGRTVFLSSHVMPEVERLCDRVAIIREGRLVAVEDMGALKARAALELEIHFAAPVPAAAFTACPASAGWWCRATCCTDRRRADGRGGEGGRAIRGRGPREPRAQPGGHLPHVLRVRRGGGDVIISAKTLRDQRRAYGWSLGVAASCCSTRRSSRASRAMRRAPRVLREPARGLRN